jgi:putative FmdB family regulatory protein
MPIYEYQCEKCGEVFEVFQKVSDPAPKSHACGSRKIKRLMSQTSFVLKGSGWYITDYGRKDQGGKEKSRSKNRDSSSESKSSESKSSDKKKGTAAA